jgi:hypothetical protein
MGIELIRLFGVFALIAIIAGLIEMWRVRRRLDAEVLAVLRDAKDPQEVSTIVKQVAMRRAKIVWAHSFGNGPFINVDDYLPSLTSVRGSLDRLKDRRSVLVQDSGGKNLRYAHLP